jgi:hypothetical protein
MRGMRYCQAVISGFLSLFGSMDMIGEMSNWEFYREKKTGKERKNFGKDSNYCKLLTKSRQGCFRQTKVRG